MARLATIAATGGVVLALGACSFVEMTKGGDDVRVVGPGQLPAGCVKRGEVEVSVKGSLGPYERDELRVKDELEVLARNEAPGLGADTVQAKGPVADGAQRFLAFHCGATPPTVSAAPAPSGPQAAETKPLKDE